MSDATTLDAPILRFQRGNPRAHTLLNSIYHWACKNDNVSQLILLGSYARDSARDDSDIDLIVVTATAETLLANTNWLGNFGTIERSHVCLEHAVPAIYVTYSSTIELEVGIVPATRRSTKQSAVLTTILRNHSARFLPLPPLG